MRTLSFAIPGCRALAAGLALGWLLLAGETAAAPVTVRDDRGVQHRLAAPPQRIVSLLPSLTESTCALGACARLVGVDRSSSWPPMVRNLPRLGGLDDAQIERIVMLKPDVVLVSRSARVVDRLEGLGLHVLVLESQSHADVRRTLLLLAQMLGAPAEGERLWASMERDFRIAASRVPSALRGKRVYFEVGAGPYAAGPSSFIGETLALIGMSNALPPELGPFPKLNPEHVVRSNPDIVIAGQREAAGLAARPGWQDMEALKKRQVCGFEPAGYDVLVRPGPRLGEAALLLAECLAGLAQTGAPS
jgi:iron complex transport system substrate-binding protein